MSEALKRIRELKARTKEACIHPDCSTDPNGVHWCDPSGNCCTGCIAVSEALRHLNNLRIEYFERAVEELEGVQEEYTSRPLVPHMNSVVAARQVLDAIEIDAKKALEDK